MNTKNIKKSVFALSTISMMVLGVYALTPTTSIKADSTMRIAGQCIPTLHTSSLQDVTLCPNDHINCDGLCLTNNTTGETQNMNCLNDHINCDGTCVTTETGTHHGNQKDSGQCGNTPLHDGTGNQQRRGHN